MRYRARQVQEPSQAHLITTVNCSTQGSCTLHTRAGSESNKKFKTNKQRHITLHKTDNIVSKKKEQVYN